MGSTRDEIGTPRGHPLSDVEWAHKLEFREMEITDEVLHFSLKVRLDLERLGDLGTALHGLVCVAVNLCFSYSFLLGQRRKRSRRIACILHQGLRLGH